jgi:hypothetical protein
MARSGEGYNLRISRRRPIGRSREIKPIEAILAAIVIAAVIGMAVWFIFFSSGGIGAGTV